MGGARVLGASLLALAACGASGASPTPPPTDLGARVIADFERATLRSKEAFLELFDFVAVGKVEKLLHRYDVLGRAELDPETRAAWERERPAPFSPERERRNVGTFYPILAQRTVGTGRCRAVAPVDAYARRLGGPFEPLPPSLAAYEPLRREVNALFARGGLVGITCAGGRGGLALVYTRAAGGRGYRLITIYDDPGLARRAGARATLVSSPRGVGVPHLR